VTYHLPLALPYRNPHSACYTSHRAMGYSNPYQKRCFYTNLPTYLSRSYQVVVNVERSIGQDDRPDSFVHGLPCALDVLQYQLIKHTARAVQYYSIALARLTGIGMEWNGMGWDRIILHCAALHSSSKSVSLAEMSGLYCPYVHTYSIYHYGRFLWTGGYFI
jgi:hypothetical protein